MTLLTILLPALNFLLMLTFSRLVHWKQLAGLIIFTMTTALLYLLSTFTAFVSGEATTATLGSWVHSGLFEVNWTFSVDTLTYTMLIVVLTVSTLVHLYSTEYMSEDPHISRFISYLSLFTFFMLLLITADNFVNLFLGWEGVGLCSYLLISFWFTRVQANKAAIKAMVVNRIADLAFTIGMLTLFYTFQTTEFNVVFGLTPYLVDTTILFGGGQLSPVTLIGILLFLGAMGKSAQIGLHTWLPDAMEGPTPVSALIHAATMVTAGVFLLIRSSGLYEFTPGTLAFITAIGAGTAFMAATSGLLQNDLKKVIAYSTCSQLGYMVFACGLSSYALSLFHLSNHAFFKALLFLSAGAVIHAISSEQDMRRLGGLLRVLPYTYAMFLIGSLALMGFPFLTGYYSKDLILEVAASTTTNVGYYAYALGLITALFTAFYSLRLLNLVFYGTSRSPRTYLLHAHELTSRMAVALAVLSLGSIFFGYLFRDLFVGFGTTAWSGVIAQAPETTGAQLAGEFLTLGQKLLPLFGCIGSAILLFLNETTYSPYLASVYNDKPTLVTLHRFLTSKWGFDAVYNRIINQPLLRGAYNITFSLIDKGLLEVFGPTGAGKITYRVGLLLARCQTGRVYDYAAFMVLVIYITLALLNGAPFLTTIEGLTSVPSQAIQLASLLLAVPTAKLAVIIKSTPVQSLPPSLIPTVTFNNNLALLTQPKKVCLPKPSRLVSTGPDRSLPQSRTKGQPTSTTFRPAETANGLYHRYTDCTLLLRNAPSALPGLPSSGASSPNPDFWVDMLVGGVCTVLALWAGKKAFTWARDSLYGPPAPLPPSARDQLQQVDQNVRDAFHAWNLATRKYWNELAATDVSNHGALREQYLPSIEAAKTAFISAQQEFLAVYKASPVRKEPITRLIQDFPNRQIWRQVADPLQVSAQDWLINSPKRIQDFTDTAARVDRSVTAAVEYSREAPHLNRVISDLAQELGFLDYDLSAVPAGAFGSLFLLITTAAALYVSRLLLLTIKGTNNQQRIYDDDLFYQAVRWYVHYWTTPYRAVVEMVERHKRENK